MAPSLRPLFVSTFNSLFLLLLCLGCFSFTSKHQSHTRSSSKKRRQIGNPLSVQSSVSSPSRRKLNPSKALSSSWSFLKLAFTRVPASIQSHPNPSLLSPSSSTRSLRQSSVVFVNVIPPEITVSDPPPEPDISADQQIFPLRNDIHPCSACGEIFLQPNLLEQHKATKHAVSELIDGVSGNNIVRIIFKSGWPDKAKNPSIDRILKIQNNQKILTRFEEYRECVKTKASGSRRRDERCIADGNELLRFHCTTFLCDLGLNGNSSLCNQQYCSVCGIIKTGFSPKMDGISTLSTSWRAHAAIPDEIEEEFKFMHVQRAMLVCRVIAGRVGCDPGIANKDDPGFDSLAGSTTSKGAGVHSCRMDDEDELLVFNPRAVLPCFVIVYRV